MRAVFALLAIVMLLADLPGIAAAAQTPQPPLQLRPQQQSSGQAVQQPDVPAELHDIRGPLELPEPAPYLLLGLIALAALVALALLYWWIFRRQRPVPPPIPPAVRARAELMRARELMAPERALSYMQRISEILRNYLEARFLLPTTRQTTREFFRHLANAPELAACEDDLQSCLERCDMAKFAHQPAALDQLQAMEESVLELVNRTEPAAAQSPDGGGS